MDLFFLTATQASELIRKREISPVDLVKACIRRIEALDDQVKAFITFTPEQALAEAKLAEAEISSGRSRGPLHGIPFGLKDVIDAAGLLTSGHSKIGLGNVPTRDATATTKLREAGAILLGKVATHEMAFGGCFDLPFPPARNPWTCEHFTSPPFHNMELEKAGIRTILNSDEIMGGATTFSLPIASGKFRSANPGIYAAFVSALREGIEISTIDRKTAAEIYLKMTGDRKTSVEEVVKMLSRPEVRYTLTPENVQKMVDFMANVGTIKTKPAS